MDWLLQGLQVCHLKKRTPQKTVKGPNILCYHHVSTVTQRTLQNMRAAKEVREYA
ncbi:mCG142674, partial [Mus musculus]